jgi:L-iditol 2-dehydrogenase
MIVGMGSPTTTLPLMAASSREIDLIGVFRYANTYPQAIEILSQSGEDYPDFSKLLTHRFNGFENATEAFDMAGKPKDVDGNLVIKVLLEMADGATSKSVL